MTKPTAREIVAREVEAQWKIIDSEMYPSRYTVANAQREIKAWKALEEVLRLLSKVHDVDGGWGISNDLDEKDLRIALNEIRIAIDEALGVSND